MDATELQATKDAYIDLTQYFIDNGIAETSNFAVINFSRNATLNANLTADEAISTIENLKVSNNPIEGTKYNDALYNALLFFAQSPLDISNQNNIAFFTSEGKSQTNFSDDNDVSYSNPKSFVKRTSALCLFSSQIFMTQRGLLY